MQHVSSDHQIYGNSGLYLLKLQHTQGLFVRVFDLKETCYSLSKLKPELPEIGGSEDNTCLLNRIPGNQHICIYIIIFPWQRSSWNFPPKEKDKISSLWRWWRWWSRRGVWPFCWWAHWCPRHTGPRSMCPRRTCILRPADRYVCSETGVVACWTYLSCTSCLQRLLETRTAVLLN